MQFFIIHIKKTREKNEENIYGSRLSRRVERMRFT